MTGVVELTHMRNNEPGTEVLGVVQGPQERSSAESILVCDMNVENDTVVVGGIHCRDRQPGVITNKCYVGVLGYRV